MILNASFDSCKLLSFIVSIVFLVGLFWFAKKLRTNGFFSGFSGMSGKYMQVLDRVALSQSSTLMIVKVGSKYLLVCVSKDSVTFHDCLAESDLDELRKG
ncbi:MAG: flagellar biosynthetic protein FliO [Oscillospiraceae bacterium]|jgi:flagellar biogenesis protein FliO|nr:flagellar biosynthetic protein FliO [Oscillospiraceae bacterium]